MKKMPCVFAGLLISVMFALLYAKESNLSKVDDMLKEKNLFAYIGVCVKTDKPPVIDGNIDDPCWKKSYVFENFSILNSYNPAKQKTNAYILYDKNNLYIGVKCDETQMNKIKAEVTERDGEIYKDDCVEFFIIPPSNRFLKSIGAGTGSFHIAVNPLGIIADEITAAGPWVWDANISVKTQKTETGWAVELSVPFSEFKTNTPLPCEVWAFNINRQQQPMKELSG